MYYVKLLQIADITDERTRLTSYVEYYKSIAPKGLYFVHFVPLHNAIAICCPNGHTHYETTSFLLSRKHTGTAINTLRTEANALKKFLDFLFLWQIDLLEIDLFITLGAFADYLRLIPTDFRPRHVLEWMNIDYVPLHDKANMDGKLIELQQDRTGRLTKVGWNKHQLQTIQRIVAIAVQYLLFLSKRTATYATLRLSDIPVKSRYVKTILSGTLGQHQVKYYDIQTIIRATTDDINFDVRPICPDEIFTIEQMNIFMSAITSPLDRLLFSILQCQGLRAGEAANLRLDDTTLPHNLQNMELFEAKEHLRTHLRGDIEFIPNAKDHLSNAFVSGKDGRWRCSVVDRGNPNYRAGHKTSRNRHIPWLPQFRQARFLELLYEALKEREQLVRQLEKDHGFLFVSRDHKALGQPITGASIARKYQHIASSLTRNGCREFLHYSPHTFRHYYASYLLSVLKESIDDVSRWLGHLSVETTRRTYLHWIAQSAGRD